jgi:Probable lipoprotein LpqN
VKAVHGVAALALLAAVAVSGCGAETPDYQSVWRTSATAAAAPTTTDTPVPIAAYLDSIGVTGEPVPADKLTDLTVRIPTPAGWQPYTNARFEPGTRVIANGETYPIAMLIVYRLSGDFDVAKALSHADADAELSENFKRLNASDANYHGFPSSMIEGSYDLNGQRMQSYNRVVIATGAPPAKQRYLVQLTVTSFADEAQKYGKDVEQIISGFTVAAKTS